MLDREPFLKAIFADPDNDLPRLVFADFLDDHGDRDWAEFIRLDCEIDRSDTTVPGDSLAKLVTRRLELVGRLGSGFETTHRGFAVPFALHLDASQLEDPDGFRKTVLECHPAWYGAIAVIISSGRITSPAQVEALLTSPVTEHMTALNLSGTEEQLGTAHDDALGIGLIDFVHRPAITTRMVEHLCGMREARRLVSLDLTRNDLDNDALRALARSTNLIRLKELHLSDGNPRFKGRVWSQVLERFGPEVVR